MAHRTTKDFINEAIEVHGTKYDYSKTRYTKAANKVIVSCPVTGHGDWFTTYFTHVTKGHGCQKCGAMRRGPKKESLVKKFVSVHGDKYDYSEVKWDNNKKHGWHTKVKIYCKVHDYFFFQTPAMHFYEKQGCRFCGIENARSKQRKNFEDSVSDARKIHGNSYIYLEFHYKDRTNSRSKRVYFEMICTKHPQESFLQRRSHHLSGSGCRKCRQSKGERKIANFLKGKNIKFIQEKKFVGLKDKAQLLFDFWLPELNKLIEFDGEQHHIKIERGYFKNELKNIQRRDRIKDAWAKQESIPLLRIRWDDDIEKSLIKFLEKDVTGS